jgi:adenylosuccinate synthase
VPTENAEIADMLHALGREFGATTGRPRRCGWFDAVATSQATMINGIDELAVTNLDGLDTLERIKICVGYRVGATRYDCVPNDIEAFAACEPVYEELPGWRTATNQVREWKRLPRPARSYLKAIAEYTGARLGIVSVGPARDQTFFV